MGLFLPWVLSWLQQSRRSFTSVPMDLSARSANDNEAEMIYLLDIVLLLVLITWLDRTARAQEAAALTLIRLYAVNESQLASLYLCSSDRKATKSCRLRPSRSTDRAITMSNSRRAPSLTPHPPFN